ncbi:hypothetical protein CFC21_016745 [Triticum aestivum]|uniref:Reverse transcriptase zinc-binding domain-containing protein n=2 Tax=Triticum aestivum TaxID=4565 RepID=A0A3B6AXF3_WHEAT|nr:uncharacterized protein LOC123188626 isoform X2 [Triticum aestivum]KAF7000984.1 hypothetical protein CFC21_016745 [Triticum aestivum]
MLPIASHVVVHRAYHTTTCRWRRPRLAGRGGLDLQFYSRCVQEEGTVDHILIHCVYASQVWFQCFTKVEIPLELLPHGHERVEDWWVASRKRVPKVQRKDYDSCHGGLLEFMEQRNSMVFGRSNMCNELDTVRDILRER